MELSEQDRRIARAVQFHLGSSFEELGRRLKLSQRIVRTAVHRLVDNGVLTPVAWLDPFRLGFQVYNVYFSVSAGSKQEQALFRLLETSPRVSWFAVLGGNHQYTMSLCVRSPAEFAQWIDRVEARIGQLFHNKHLATVLDHRIFPSKYLSPKWGAPEEIAIEELQRDIHQPDEIDILILSNLTGAAVTSAPELARRIGAPRSTVQYRLEQLEKRGVIKRYLYFLDPAKFGATAYKLLLYARGSRRTFREPLIEFARNHRHFVNFSECLGNWDFECTIEAEHSEEVHRISNELYSKFGEFLSQIVVLTVFSRFQSQKFMHLAMGDL